MIKLVRAVLVFVITSVVALVSPLAAFAESNRTTYIVMPAEGAAAELRSAISSLGEYPEDQLNLIDDLFIVDLLPEDAIKLAESALVAFIEADSIVSITDSQTPTPSWGLDRIDGYFDNAFSYPSKSGEGVKVYVFDTGVAGDHPDLAGRVSQGFDVIGSNQANTDCHYHGTHVAGTIAGSTFGLAKNAEIVPIRVLGCTGSGSTTGILRAINWTIANHPASTPGVANLSLGGSRNLSFNAAIASMVDRGITTVVAAGNSYADACKYSPASAPEAITVGATDRFDSKAAFSNFGDCVDVFAPGVSIPSANARNYAAPISLSGTSMASPHVAGVAALILGESPAASTEQVEAQIYALSQPGVVKNANTVRGNRMAVSPPQNFKPIPTLPGAPSGLRVSETGSGFVDFSWNVVSGASSYEVEFRKGSQNVFTLATSSTADFRVSGLSGGELAYLRVRAVTDLGTTKFSALVSGKSQVQPPSAPRELRVDATSKTAMRLSWQPPTSLGGALSVQYRVQMKTTGDWMQINSGPATSISISDLQFAHSFRVLAFHEGGASESSVEVVFDPAKVYVVSSISSTVSGRTADVIWVSDAPEGTAHEVSLTRVGSTSPERTQTVSTNSVRFENLSRMTSYRVSIIPLAEIRGFGQTATFETGATAPEAPRAISAPKQSSGYLLRFAQPSDNGGSAITTYRLEQLVGGIWTKVQESLSLEFSVADPARGQTSEYRLIAVNAVGESPASSTLRVSTPADVASSPQSLSAVLQADGRVQLNWLAPTDDGGAPVTQYRIEILRNGVWSMLGSASQLTYTYSSLAKGTQASFRVTAVNRAGSSLPSNTVELSREKTVPGNISNLTAAIKDGYINLSWGTVSDTGGGTISGYTLQQRTGSTWVDVITNTSSLSAQIEISGPGLTFTYRVLANNEVGQSASGNERIITTPYLPASAPQNFNYQVEGNRIKFNWDRAESSGGSVTTFYVISVSDDGVTYRPVSTVRATETAAYDTRPVRGQARLYRINAVTQHFGNGTPSDALGVLLPAIAPEDPALLTAKVVQGEGIVLTWTKPNSDGGAEVTGYRIEVRRGSTWSLVGESAELSFVAPFGSAGESLVHRVLATNAAGNSLGLRTVTTQMGIAPATAPQSLSASVVSGRLVITWIAPEVMGGRFSYYEIQHLDGGAFKRLAISSTTTLRTTIPGPGQSKVFRVAAFTNAGVGAFSSEIEYATAKVVPSTPSLVSMRSSAATNTITWRSSSINAGGGTVDKAVLYREENGNWVEIAQADAKADTLSFANDLYGTTQRYVLRITNEVGESANSRVTTLRHAFAVTSQATNLSLREEGTRLRLSWSTPEFLGGSNPSYADIQVSEDGTNWRRATFIRYAESALVSMPLKGRNISYRVIVRNAAGESLPSEAVSFYNPLTAPSSNFSASASRSGSNVVFRISAPSDFGGYSELAIRIEQQGTLAWQSSDEYVLVRPRGSSSFSLPLPSARGTYVYRVSISNPSGEVERTVTFRY